MRALLLLFLISLMGCSLITPKKQAVYFNDSEVILEGKSGVGICADYKYDCVVMSAGSFRNITGVTPDGKKFRLVYE